MSHSLASKFSEILEDSLSDSEVETELSLECGTDESAQTESKTLTNKEMGMQTSPKSPIVSSGKEDLDSCSHSKNHLPPHPPQGRVARALKGKIRYIFLVALIVSVISFRRYAPPINMPAGYDVDDSQRPGLLYNLSTIKVRRPVVLVPGFLNSALEVWQHDVCADGGGSGELHARLFRERMLGPQMLLMLLRDPKCFFRHLSLHNVVYGADPESAPSGSDTAKHANSRRIRIRSLNSIDSGDYVVPSYWAWAKIIRSLADVGYDPNAMVMLPFDWRLSPILTERRDGHFHKMRMQIEELVRFNEGVKVVIIAHSYGGIMITDFLNWAESKEEGWTERHVHTVTTIGSPMLGTPKVVSALISGEMRTTAFLPSPIRSLVDFHVPRRWRTDVIRTLPGAEALFIRGCDAVWPNVVTLYNQTVVLRGSDVYEMIRTLTKLSNSTAMHQRFTEKRHEYNALPHLPKSPSLNVYAFYGADLQTEVGYAYTLAQETTDAGEVETKKALMDIQLRQWLYEGGVDIQQAESALAEGAAAMETLAKERLYDNQNQECVCEDHEVPIEHKAKGPMLTSQGGNVEPESLGRPDASSLSTEDAPTKKSSSKCRRCATSELFRSVPLATPISRRKRDEFAAIVKTVADHAADLWSSYVYGGEHAIANEAINSLVGAFSLDNPPRRSSCSTNEVNKPKKSDREECSEDTSRRSEEQLSPNALPLLEPIKDDHKLALQSRLHLAPPGILWRPEYLGNFSSGSDLALDRAVHDVEVLPLLQKISGDRRQHNTGAGSTTNNKGVFGGNDDDDSSSRAESTVKIPYRDHVYQKGVKMGPGDATVPLISLGYMSRSPNGWRKDVKKVVTKEYFDGFTAEMHSTLEKKILQERLNPGSVAEKDISTPAQTANDSTATETTDKALSPEVEAILRTLAQDFLKSVDIRGGTTSADHVDLLGNYELIWDLLHIVTGNEDKVSDRILTDIDERVEECQCQV